MLISKKFPCWEQSLARFKPCVALWPGTFVPQCLWPFFQAPQMSPQSDHCVREGAEATAAGKDPAERPDLWQTSSLKGCAGREGFRACEIITVLNLSSHGQLVNADKGLGWLDHIGLSPSLLCHVLSFLQQDYHIPFPLIGEMKSMLV